LINFYILKLFPSHKVYSLEVLTAVEGVKPVKIAVSGKGGVGKTTFSANLAKIFASEGYQVYAVDADPDASLGTTLGIAEDVLTDLKPVVHMKELIEERVGGDGAFFPLNPKVDDLVQSHSIDMGNIHFFRMGNVKQGGTSCYCKENTFLHALVNSLLLSAKDTVILDMGAGIEQLTRGTARGVDFLFIVTEPTKVSVQTAKVVRKLALELGVPNIRVIGNKVRNKKEEEFLQATFEPGELLGILPYSNDLADAALEEGSLEVPGGELGSALEDIFHKIIAKS
jgi:CO dehydrogenase maturation factor